MDHVSDLAKIAVTDRNLALEEMAQYQYLLGVGRSKRRELAVMEAMVMTWELLGRPERLCGRSGKGCGEVWRGRSSVDL